MSYEFYKVMHIGAIIIFISGLGISFLGDNTNKVNKILTGISGFILLVAGMGLKARVISKGSVEPWPMWLILKVMIWTILAIGGPILSKRLKGNRGVAFYSFIVLAIAAAYMAVNKPF
jgi:uncharacterized membrane protein SirB2